MIGRIRERRDFERLSRDGRRARSATLWCRYLDVPTLPPSVAYAIGRAVGPAVVRNRLRRRLRALVTASGPDALPHGLLLIGARPAAAERSFDELAGEVRTLLAAVRRREPAVSGSVPT